MKSALFFFTVLFFVYSFLSSSSLPSFSLFSSSQYYSYAISMIVHENILSRSSADISPSRSAASVKKASRRAGLSVAQSLYFLDLARLPAEAQMSTLAIGRQILPPAIAKVMSESIKTTEGKSSDPVRENTVTDDPRNLFPTDE